MLPWASQILYRDILTFIIRKIINVILKSSHHHEVYFPSANLKMLYRSSSYFKEQDIWKLIYLAELLSILLVTAHGHKRATLPPPTYRSEAKYSDWEERPLGKLGQWRQWTHQILEGPLEKCEKYSSFCLQPWGDHANLEGSLGKSGKGRQTDQKGRGRDNEGRVSHAARNRTAVLCELQEHAIHSGQMGPKCPPDWFPHK